MASDFDYSFDTAVRGESLLAGSGCLARAAWLNKMLRHDDLFLLQDGAYSRILLNELLECFIAGRFIATIVLGFSLVEREIAGRLWFNGDKAAAKGSSQELIDAAVDRNWLTPDERDQINDLRKLRNPIVHFRDHLSESRPEVKAALNARSTEQQLEKDAKIILEATIRVALAKTAL